jgi:hypothetical protein
MTEAQILAHCSVSMQWAVGEAVPEKGALPARLMGRLVKPMVFRNEDPLRKNSPTAKSLIVADERDLGKEQERLSGLIDKFAAGGAAGYTFGSEASLPSRAEEVLRKFFNEMSTFMINRGAEDLSWTRSPATTSCSS